MDNKNNVVKYISLTALNIRKEITLEDGNLDTASLTWSIRAGYPRITVYTSNLNSKDKLTGKLDFNKVITAPFDYQSMSAFLELLKEVINSSESIQYCIECFNAKYENGVKTTDVVKQATVCIGKDTNGINYIAVTSDGKPKIKFNLLPNLTWFKYLDKDKKVIEDNSLLSKIYSKGYYNMVKKTLLDTMIKESVTSKETPKPNTTPIPTSKPTTPTSPSISVSEDDDLASLI